MPAGCPAGCWRSIGILSLLAASQLAVALVNWLATLLVTPHALPQTGLFRRHPGAIAHSGGGPDHALERAERRGSGRGAGGPFLANRDERLHFGLLTDLQDAQRESLPEDGPLVQLARARIERAEREIRRRRGPKQGRHLLPVPSSAPLERAGTDLDGLRAQARQACGPERTAARRLRGPLFTRRRRHRGPVRSEVRDHAGHRYAAAARCGAATRRRHGAPAEPHPLRRSEAARRARATASCSRAWR